MIHQLVSFLLASLFDCKRQLIGAHKLKGFMTTTQKMLSARKMTTLVVMMMTMTTMTTAMANYERQIDVPIGRSTAISPQLFG